MTLKIRAAACAAAIGIVLLPLDNFAFAAATSPYPGDSFKKITSAPTEPTGKEDDAIVDENGHLVEASPGIRRGDVEILPAPGASELGRGHAPASISEPGDQKSETKAESKQESSNTASTESAHSPAAVKAPALKVETKPTAATLVAPASAVAAAATAAAASEPAKSNAEAEQSLKWLTNGNVRFVKKANRADGRSAADRKRIENGASPHAIVLSCSDSRVPPELIFDQALGEIVTIRVAGEALDSSVIASIESELHGNGPKLLVVLGHTNCSTVDAAVHLKEGQSAGSEFLDKAMNEIRPHLKTANSEHPSKDLAVESTLVADGTARELVKRSEVIRHKVETGELVIKSALYRLDSGKVTFY